MIANQVQQALAQVRQVQLSMLARQRFPGYSGKARMLSGGCALAVAGVMAQPRFPVGPGAHLGGWLLLFLAALILNYGAVLYWFLFDPKVKREARKLLPLVDVLPPLAVGGLLSVALMWRGYHDLLPGVWMALFGLANLASRHVLPRGIVGVGLLYVAAGAGCLLAPGLTFTNPWPMGVTFCVGELAAGLILQLDQTRKI